MRSETPFGDAVRSFNAHNPRGGHADAGSQNVFAATFYVALLLVTSANISDDFGGSRQVSAALGFPGGLLWIVCAVILLSDWRGLPARLARRRDESRFWRIAGQPLIARAAGVLLFGAGVLIAVVTARAFV